MASGSFAAQYMVWMREGKGPLTSLRRAARMLAFVLQFRALCGGVDVGCEPLVTKRARNGHLFF
jgi:hypothetical protein